MLKENYNLFSKCHLNIINIFICRINLKKLKALYYKSSLFNEFHLIIKKYIYGTIVLFDSQIRNQEFVFFLFSQEDTDMSYNYTAMHIILMIKELLTIFTLNGPEPMCLSNLIYTLFFVHNAPINDI